MKSPVPIALIGLALLSLVGCTKEPDYRVYTVKKEKPKEMRILGAIIPKGAEGVFIKGTGSPEMLDSVLEPFKKMVQDSVVDGPNAKWALPESWTMSDANDGVSNSILEVPSGRNKIRFTVTELPNSVGTWEEYVKNNVDRWRGQVSLSPAPLDAQPNELTVLTRPDNPNASYIVDVRGASAKGGPRMGGGPQMGGPMSQAPKGDQARGGSQGPSLRFATPEGWTAQAEPKAFRIAGFDVKNGELTGEASIAAARNNIDENSMMWQQQISPDSPEDAIKTAASASVAAAEPVESGLGPGSIYLFRQGDQPDADSVLIVVIPIPGSESCLFAKLRGKLPLVTAERQHLTELVKSFKVE